MVERQAIVRLSREYQLLDANPNPQFAARPSESDMLTWHYVLVNLPKESPYYGGQYHGKLIFPRDYPLKPPSILMCTPSGRFEVNKRLCLSMSDYHPESWNPSWRVETILIGLVSFMLDESDPATAGGIRTSASNRVNEARLSFFRNRRNRDFMELFPELCDVSKYVIGSGYSYGEIPTGSLTLQDCSLNEQQIDSIQGLDDLNAILRLKGVQYTPNEKSSAIERNLFNRLLPWSLVGIMVGSWLYSQFKGVLD
jgi:ubiquitin-conjugating enzyme E2 J2